MFHQPHSQRCSLLQAGDVAQVLACTEPWVPMSALPKHTHLQTQYSRGETEPQKFKVISAIQLVWDQTEAHETLSEKNSNLFSPAMSLWGLLEDPRAFSHLWGLRTYHWWVVSRSAIKKKSNNGYFRIRNPIYWGWCNGSRNRRTCCWLWRPEFKSWDTHRGKSKLPQEVYRTPQVHRGLSVSVPV